MNRKQLYIINSLFVICSLTNAQKKVAKFEYQNPITVGIDSNGVRDCPITICTDKPSKSELIDVAVFTY